jgi:CRP-like cAMP-binding protein
MHQITAATSLRHAQSAIRLHGTTEAEQAGPLELAGAIIHYDRNSEIFGEGEDADYIYRVISGAVRSVKLLADGRRQIGSFHLPGDWFGIEAEEQHQFSADAVSDCEILVIGRAAALAMAERDGEVARTLLSVMTRDLGRARDHMLLLGRKNAGERIAAFLMEMDERTEGENIRLPMSRYDIADYLGLTIETVSRTITEMCRKGWISLAGARRLSIRKPEALRQLGA